jgi:uncharacterized protein
VEKPNRILTRALPLCIGIFILAGGLLHAAETPIPPAPTQSVTDTANFLSFPAAESLNARLESYEQSTHHQLLVYIGQTTGDATIEDWAERAFAKWKVGRKGIDDGLVLFIMSGDRKLRFEVGYGLEPIVPDVTASRIINEVMVPRIQAGDRDGAVASGMDAVMTVIGGGGLPAESTPGGRRNSRPSSFLQLIFYGVIGIIILVILITNPSLAVYLLMSMLSSGGSSRRDRDGWGGGGWGGGGFGGGGGFSGGGGSSGGGGASGSW